MILVFYIALLHVNISTSSWSLLVVCEIELTWFLYDLSSLRNHHQRLYLIYVTIFLKKFFYTIPFYKSVHIRFPKVLHKINVSSRNYFSCNRLNRSIDFNVFFFNFSIEVFVCLTSSTFYFQMATYIRVFLRWNGLVISFKKGFETRFFFLKIFNKPFQFKSCLSLLQTMSCIKTNTQTKNYKIVQ